MEIFVARQPIFDRQQRVYGYELLYRGGQEEKFQETDGDKASLSVIRNTLLVIGVDKVAEGKKAFINFTRSLLLDESAFYLPKGIAVIEILEDIAPDPEVLASCKKIKENGYTLALDDFVLKGNERNPLTELVDIIKVDFMGAEAAERKAIAKRFGRSDRVKLLAEKTETREEFQEALDLGYSYFQGYFFSKPVIISRKNLPAYKVNGLQILHELSRERLDFEALQKVVKRDPSLTYMLFKYINSAFFGLRYKVSSIKQALALLGEREVKKWISLSVLVHLGKDQPEELIRVALLRARFCESMASKVNLESQKSELFLMGMFSFMDVLLGRPLEEILDGIPLLEELKEALLGKENAYKMVYDLVLQYEKGAWKDVSQLAEKLRVNEEDIPEIYSESIDWLTKVLMSA